MLCSCVRISVSIYHECVTSVVLPGSIIYSCNIRLICTKSQDLALKISPGVIPPDPQGAKGCPPPAPTSSTACAAAPPRCQDPRFQKRSPKSKIATTPLLLLFSTAYTVYTDDYLTNKLFVKYSIQTYKKTAWVCTLQTTRLNFLT